MFGTVLQLNLVQISITIVVSIVSILSTSYLINRRVESAKEERRKQAKETILEILENRLVEDREISDKTMEDIISSANNTYNSNLYISYIELFQELILRIEQSRHLSAEEKDAYISKINETSDEISDEEYESIEVGLYDDLIQDIKTELQRENTEEALQMIESYESNPENFNIDSGSKKSTDIFDILLEKLWFNIIVFLMVGLVAVASFIGVVMTLIQGEILVALIGVLIFAFMSLAAHTFGTYIWSEI
jgi:hypothetical protein